MELIIILWNQHNYKSIFLIVMFWSLVSVPICIILLHAHNYYFFCLGTISCLPTNVQRYIAIALPTSHSCSWHCYNIIQMASFNIILAYVISLIICFEIVLAHAYVHREFQQNIGNVNNLATTCTCTKSSHCLPWCSCHDGLCQCDWRNKLTPTGNIIKCSNNTSSASSYLEKCHCLTSDSKSGKVYVGLCMYTCGNVQPEDPLKEEYYSLPCNLTSISSYLCARFGRDGLMCGNCKDGLSPYVLSYNVSCVECQNASKNWWKFILFGFIPLTCFYIFVLVFHVNVTSSRMQTIVLFNQIISVSA